MSTMPLDIHKEDIFPPQKSYFDQYSDQYAEQLQKGLSATGEDAIYFARSRVFWLSCRLMDIGYKVYSVLDFGCGVGNSVPFFIKALHAEKIVGLDPSPATIQLAQQKYASHKVSFVQPKEFNEEGYFDLAFCNGVFHHIPLGSRSEALKQIWKSLKPGGLFAFWENNPWNPGTLYVMSRVDFDKDAITIKPQEARKLLKASGFTVLKTDYLFIFPKSLKWFRPLEPFLSALPFGGQYMVLCTKSN